MKILMITPYFPWPVRGGASMRIFNIVKKLSQKGYKIVLLAGRKKNQSISEREMSKYCEKIYFYSLPSFNRFFSLFFSLFSFLPYPAFEYQSKDFLKKIFHLLENEPFDLIWINFLFMSNFLLKINIKTPVVLDQFEADEILWERYIREGSIFQKFFAFLNLKKIQFLQKRIFKKVNALFCVSKKEAEFMKSRTPKNTRVWVVPNGVDTEFFQFKRAKRSNPIILFLGAMCVRRNIDAVIWFIKKIFPKIKKAIPEVQFQIVGHRPGKEISVLNKISGIKVIGTVEDVRPYYEKAKVYVAPFRFGEGTRLKILEAMATGVPIVSTKEGCQGIDVVDGEHLLIAKNKNEFGEKVIELLSSPQKSKVLAESARKLVEEKYSWKKIINDLELKLKNYGSYKKSKYKNTPRYS